MELKAFLRMRVWIPILLSLALVFGPALSGWAEQSNPSKAGTKKESGDQLADAGKQSNPYYFEVLEKWKKAGATADHKGSITVPGAKVAARSSNANLTTGPYDGKNDVLIWHAAGDEWIEYEVNVAVGGLYEIEMSYHSFVGSKYRKPVALNLTVDGAVPFAESKSLELFRHWKDKFPIRKDERGDEIRPTSDDISGWLTWQLRDMTGAYADPLTWYLTPGKHRIRLAGSDPVALESITLKAPAQTADYQSVRKGQPAEVALQTEPIVIEAEQLQWKNDLSAPLAYDNDTFSTPYERGHITYNVIDGSRWGSNNQEISWSFEAPEAGFYKIAMRADQSYVSNRSSFRQILINGKVPFSEMKAYRFLYASGWKSLTLADEQGEPYQFYLQKGANTISMRVTQAPLKESAVGLEKIIEKLRVLSADLRVLTGGVDDKNRTWNIESDLPGFIDDLRAADNRLDQIRLQLEAINGRSDAVSQALATVRKDIDDMLKDPDEIPYNAGRLVTLQGKVADQIKQLSYQPLQLDRIVVAPVNKPFPRLVANFQEKFTGVIVNFFNSFIAKGSKKTSDEVLDVWMMRGRDYVNLLQGMADESFTQQTGIKVRVNLLKDEKLLVMMNAAGIAPDVALGLQQDIPFNYAIRNGIYNLKEFPDFDEYYKRFAPGSWTPFYYNGGYYGVPETQTFEVMYYRKDIFERLGLKIPETWEDLYKILPVLQQNGMNFTPVNHGVFMQMFGAEYFTQDGSRSGLTAEKGFDAFKQWTDLQNKYALDQKMDSFYQHFRDGSFPIGIADLNTYLQLTVAAPELNGLWGVAPVPGVRQADGKIARWMGGNMQGATILKNGKHPQESWEFLKWWTSAEVQQKYGSELEALNGVTFRWNTSNIDAFVQLPWKEEDLKSILEQWKWFREIPNVPGSYFMERELTNAWNRTVVDGMNYRTSLETAVKEVDREIARKLQEFKFIDQDGRMVKSLNLPVISQPWEGVEPYVKN